ncbi:MAG: hypothetical protein IJM54_04115 [Thermoguttaceae bacterium]|nr:hypothetical protein [Thermoguttaceae bacterium]
MAISQTCERALKSARLFVFSCCALAVGTSAALAQSANFRAPSLTNSSANAEPAARSTQQVAIPFESPKQAYVASPISAEQRPTIESKIKSVSASAPAPQPVVRQTQYANRAPFVQELKNDGEFIDVCPDPNEMPPITEVPYKFVTSPGKVPESCPLPDQEYQRKAPTPITFTWKASSLCYKPLYFEDVQLERYGHYCHPLQQPVCSRVRFWLTIPCLPYLMGVNPPRECIYDLGYYRPGNCAPSMIEPIPISLRGGLMEAGTMVGLAALIP